jgi:hypothetical protein
MSRAATNPTPQLLFRALFHEFSKRFSVCFSACLVICRYAGAGVLDRSFQACPPMFLNTRRCTICWKDSLFKDIVEQYLGVVVVKGVLDDEDNDF